jgi:hypothetical protein
VVGCVERDEANRGVCYVKEREGKTVISLSLWWDSDSGRCVECEVDVLEYLYCPPLYFSRSCRGKTARSCKAGVIKASPR